MKKILITGSTGFIGSNLLKRFYPKNKIYVILRKKSKNKYKIKNYKDIKIIFYDNFDELDRKLKKIKVDVVFHCATHYVKSHKPSDIFELSKSNISFGNIILENLKTMNVNKFINFSTVWENYNSIKDNSYNLYSVYKKSFRLLIDFYAKNLSKISFFNIMISDTFGENDSRLKIINVLRENYKKNIKTRIISKNLFINLINISDIVGAIKILVEKNISSGTYLVKNKIDFKMVDLVDSFNKKVKKKIKIKWLSNKILKEKIYPYKKIINWKPKESSIRDIIDILKK